MTQENAFQYEIRMTWQCVLYNDHWPDLFKHESDPFIPVSGDWVWMSMTNTKINSNYVSASSSRFRMMYLCMHASLGQTFRSLSLNILPFEKWHWYLFEDLPLFPDTNNYIFVNLKLTSVAFICILSCLVLQYSLAFPLRVFCCIYRSGG